MKADSLEDHEIMALQFLEQGPDCVGVVDSEEKMAAALVFIDLQKRGYLMSSIGESGPTFYITPAGRDALKRAATSAQ